MSFCHTDGPFLLSILGLSEICGVSTTLLRAFSPVYHIPSSLICLLTLFFYPHFDLTHFTLLSFFIFASISPLFFGISVSFHKWFCQPHCFILVSPSLRSLPCLSIFSVCLVSSCLNLYWCFSFRQLMENKITTIERGAFQDLKELERLWVQIFLSSNQIFTEITTKMRKKDVVVTLHFADSPNF